MEADWLEVLWVVGLARTREGGVREHATAAVLKPREEGMGRGGPARLMLREGGGPVHLAQRKTGPDGRQLHGRGEGGGRSGTCRMKQGKGWVHGPQLLWARPNRNIAVS
jgi:hypothetical protein